MPVLATLNRHMIRGLICGCLLLHMPAFPLFADEVHTLGGKTITGTLQSITDSEVTLKADTGSVTTPVAQVLAVDLRPVKGPAPAAKYLDVRLLDDSLLHCRSATFQGNDVELTLLSGRNSKRPSISSPG